MSVTLTDEDLPPLFLEADRLSGREQARFFGWTIFSLILLILVTILSVLAGTVGGEAGWVDVVAALAGALFVVLAFTSFYLEREHPDGRWYQARAVAESVKTLAWQYAAGGGELMCDGPDDPDVIFRSRLNEMVRHLPEGMNFRTARAQEQITPRMRELRGAGRDVRFQVYFTNRIEDQRDWYSGKSDEKYAMARTLSLCVIAIQLVGVALAGIGACGLVDVGFLGIPAAISAGIIALQQTKDYTVLARSYRVAADDLEDVRIAAENKKPFTGESAWAEFVDTAEQAISREHTLWLARRGVTPR